jgi:putative ABC transport system permease protein
MNTAFYVLGWRSLWRDVRAGELRLLIVAVSLAVAALTAVGFFADRLNGGLQRDARQLLGGDAVISSDNPTPQVFIDKAKALGLQTAFTLGFPTMARAPSKAEAAGTGQSDPMTKLVALKAVSDAYPLRGNLQIVAKTGADPAKTRTVPALGEAWVDATLLDGLGLQVGDKLLLGDVELRIGQIITTEPDRGAGFANFAPRVMVNMAGMAATGLIQPASRVTYRFAVAGTSSAGPVADKDVKAFVDFAKTQIANGSTGAGMPGVRLESFEGGRPEMKQTLDRAEKFLSLIALLAALLSAVAVALAARGFAAKHLDDCAMLRVLGQSQRNIGLSYTFEFALVGLFASGLGVLIGFGVHYVFVLLLAGLIESSLPAASLWPVAFGLGMGMTLLLAFGLPPVLQLARVPPLRVIRRDVGSLKPASLAVLGLGMAGFVTLLLAASSDLKLGLIAVGGFAGAVVLFAGISYLAIKLLRMSVNDATAPRWLVLATRQLTARPAFAVVQISALSLGLLALILLVLLRTDLINSWRKATPADAPNRFVINVMPEQSESFQQTLKQAGVKNFDWYPMIRGRLVAINNADVKLDSYADERAKRMLDREFNLSNSAALPAHNIITSGAWTPDETGGVSIEESVAKTLNLTLGDKLRFDVGGMIIDSQVSSVRKVDWGSMRANFYVMFPVAQLTGVPVTYMGAFRAPQAPDGAKNSSNAADSSNAAFDNTLVKNYPNITSVDMSATVSQIQKVLDQVIRAVEFLFAFTLAAGVIVLLAAITATRDERAKEFAVMRALGANGKLLRQVQGAELAGVGLLAGFLASIIAVAIGWAMARYVFEFSWNITPWVPLAGALTGSLLSLLAGTYVLRSVLRRPVIETLRQQ